MYVYKADYIEFKKFLLYDQPLFIYFKKFSESIEIVLYFLFFMDSINTKFIFKSKEFQIAIQPKDSEQLPKNVLISILHHNNYKIQSNICDSTFQSIIKYFKDGTLPSIRYDDIKEYETISNELQIEDISKIVQIKREEYGQILNNINALMQSTLFDKSDLEHHISQNLDIYLELYGDEFMKIPIQSLYNIFSYKDRNFSSDNQLYELIQSHFQKTNDSTIFILLQFINGNSISKQNLIDCLNNASLHFGYQPNLDLPSIIKMSENKDNNDQKDNKSNDDGDQNINLVQDIIRINGLNYKIDKINHTAMVYIEKNQKEILVPRSLILYQNEYLVTSIGINYKHDRDISRQRIYDHSTIVKLSDDSEIKCLNFGISFRYINVPANVEKISFFGLLVKYCSGRPRPLYRIDFTDKLKISPKNPYFKWSGNNFLLGKSTLNSKDFDAFIFASRTIESAIIPSNITYIFAIFALMLVKILISLKFLHML